MIIVYLARTGGENADVSYNAAWLGLWAVAEISFGITVTGTFLLPKFIEAEGTKLRSIFSSLTRSLPSLTSRRFGSLIQWKKNRIVSQEVALDTITMIGHSESDADSINRDQDVERFPFYEDVHHLAR